MNIFRYSLFCLLLHQSLSTPVDKAKTGDEDALVARIIRDITGQYHPELHGEHSNKHGHHAQTQTFQRIIHDDGTEWLVSNQVDANSAGGQQFDFGGSPTTLNSQIQKIIHDDGTEWLVSNQVDANSAGGQQFNLGGSPPTLNLQIPSREGLLLPPSYVPQPPKPQLPKPQPPQPQPPKPHSDHPMIPNGYANCGCVINGQCAKEVLDYQPVILSTLKNDVVCGLQYQLCCPDDPWPGPIDIFKPQMECWPEEYCLRKYGDSPYDIQTYGTLGPCLGLGSVRCIDKLPIDGPTNIVVPIYNPPPPPTLPPPVVYVPPTPTLPPTVYEPLPPAYVPPAPVETYVPPPVETYVPPVPAPVETYVPPAPAPVETYVPPAPVETYVPPAPVETYAPPAPVDTYEPPPPIDTYEPPGTGYGAPVDDDIPPPPPPPVYSYHQRYPGYYNRYHSRFGLPYSFGFPGYGFRKSFHFSKGFGFYG